MPVTRTADRSSRAKTNPVTPLALSIGAAGVGFVVLVYIFGAVALAAGFSLSPLLSGIILMSALVGGGVLPPILVKPPAHAAYAAGVAALFAVSAGVASLLMDTSLDGQWYHFQAVYSISEGWNPFHEDYRAPEVLGQAGYSEWPAHYPISSWIVMAVQLNLGLPLEMVKSLQTILMVRRPCWPLRHCGWRAWAAGLRSWRRQF